MAEEQADEIAPRGKSNDFGDGTGAIEVPQERLDALNSASNKNRNAEIRKTPPTNKNYPAIKPYPTTNGSGQVYYVEQPPNTEEKKGWVTRQIDNAKQKIVDSMNKLEEKIDSAAEDARAAAAHALGLNDGRDDLHAVDRTKEAMKDISRLGGGKLEGGPEYNVKVTTKYPALDDKINENLKMTKMKRELKLGEPCDDKKEEVGLGSSILKLIKFDKIATGLGFKKRVSLDGKIGFSASGDLVCIRPGKIVVTGAGVTAHFIENTDIVQHARERMTSSPEARNRQAEKDALE